MGSKKYGLTFPQSNIYLVEKVSGKTSINTIAGILNINDKFDERICNKIINRLIEKNDALRIKIFEEDNAAYQSIEKYVYENIEYINLIGKSEKEVKKYIQDTIKVPIKFIGNKLYDFKILRYKENTGCIFMKLHHIVSDAWTLGQIVNQLITMYNDELSNIQNKYLIPSYIDYIESEKEYVSSEKYIKNKEFWEEYFKDIQQPISLKTVTSKLTNKAERYSVMLNEELSNKIMEYVKANKVSPYTLFLGTLSTYIYRVCNKNDFVIGTPVLNRSNFKEKQMLGMFVSTMPTRIKVEESIKFIDLVKQIGTDTMTLFRHQKYPITKILEYIQKTTDIEGKIYNIVLSYQNARSNIKEGDCFSTEWVFTNNAQDNLAIHILDMDNNGRLTINYDYLVDLFDEKEIKYLHTRLMAIIENAINDIDIDVENIRIMSIEEENKILYDFNDTAKEYPKTKTMVDLFEEQVEEHSDKVALVFENEHMTYNDLNKKINILASYLREEKNIKVNDVVAVMLDKSFELMISILGILKAGAAYLPIDKSLPKERINYMLENSGCNIVVSKEDVSLNNISYIDIDNILLDNKKVENLIKVNKPNDLAYVMYTSGSTGNPKGAMMSHVNVIKLVKNITYFNMDKIDNVFLAGNIVFDASMHEMWLSLLNGKTGYIISKETMMNPIEYSKLLLQVENGLAIFTTQLFHQYSMFNPKIFEKLTYLVAGGDVMLSEYAKNIIDNCKNTTLVNIYGPTECTAAATTQIVNRDNYNNITIGKPIDNTKCYIVDSNGRLCPIFIDGEIYIAGDGVGLGYINNEEINRKSFVNFNVNDKTERVYKSGDIGNWTDDGNIKFQGRSDFQVKIRGYRIEISEILNIVLKISNIKEAYIIAKTNENTKELNMYITSDITIDITEFKKQLRKKLPDYMVPTKILQLNKMPLNSVGKIDRSRLPEISFNETKKVALPDNKTQRVLLSIFTNVLSNKQIGVDDNLFEYGLDSLQVAKVIVLCNEKGLVLGYQDIYDCKTIRNIAEKIINNDSIDEEYYKKIEDYNYDRINNMLSTETKINISNKSKDKFKGNILLTGVTGFLGSHILENIINNYDSVVYCVVRSKEINGQKRLEDKLKYYFGDSILKHMETRIRVIDIDLLEYNSNIELQKIIKGNNINLLINCAANVKHYGNRDEFEKLNVDIVKNIINISKSCKIRLIHISTLSVSGNGFETSFDNQTFGKNKYFNEKSMYINQKITNIYAYTKYISELCVLEARVDGLDSSVIRVGNLMSRYRDGKFQENITDNGFVQRIKFVLDNAIIPKNVYDTNYLEFSQVDILSNALMKLVTQKSINPIYHLFNNNHIYIKKFIKSISKIYGRKIEVLSTKDFSIRLDEVLNNDTLALYRVILSDLKENGKLEYITDVVVESKITNKILRKLKFKWCKINSRYIKLFIESIYNGKDIKNIWKN
ncbi:MAG: amino acid adenylation domain-containing protein [Clostridia bacterium]|nr:amino acid adenylation domain-containing protein [Clostridia bacterium]